ncbi:MAG: helix-turn-helix domain-containing protein [Dokdonella sp.]
MTKKSENKAVHQEPDQSTSRPMRADARRNIDGVLQAAKKVFASAGVDAPMRAIAEAAGVGVGTIYRHFPQRADLIAAVFRQEIDACAQASASLSAQHAPGIALAKWMQRYADFIATKRGLATALHSGNPAFESLPAYFKQHLRPALQSLLESAASVHEIRADVDPDDLLHAVASLCMPARDEDRARRMVNLLVDGLRYGSTS